MDGVKIYAGPVTDGPKSDGFDCGRPFMTDNPNQSGRLIGSVLQPKYGGWVRPRFIEESMYNFIQIYDDS